MTSNELKATLEDLIWKAANTFWQAFSVVFVFTDLSSLKATGAAAVAAGLAAVKTFISGYLKNRV